MCGDCPFPPLLCPQRGTGCCPCPDPSCVAWCSPSSSAAAACRSRCSASGSWRWSTFPRPCRNRCRGSWRSWAPPAAAASASASWRYRCGRRGRPSGEPPGRGSSRTRRRLQQITPLGWTLGVPQGRDVGHENSWGEKCQEMAVEKGLCGSLIKKWPWLGFIYLFTFNQAIDQIYICWGFIFLNKLISTEPSATKRRGLGQCDWLDCHMLGNQIQSM